MSALAPPRKKQKVTSVAEEAADEVGSGLAVTNPPRNVPHLYNNNFTVKLTYADNIASLITCNGSDGVSQLFRMNSIYDPDYTGVGHQPLCRDLWASMYDYYTVLQCDYKIKLFNCSNDPITFTAAGTSGQLLTSCNVTFGATTNVTDFTTPVTSFIYPLAEMKNMKTKMLLPQHSIKFKGSLTPGDFIVDAVDADSDAAWTAVGANPTVPRYFGYGITPVAQGNATGASETPYAYIQAQVILHYTVQFTQINPSLRQTSS